MGHRRRRPRNAGQRDVRPLSPDAAPWRGRHGHRLPGRPRRSAERRGDQDPPRCLDLASAARPFRKRTADPRAVEPSVDRQAVRRGHLAGRNPLAGHGIRRRRAAHPPLPCPWRFDCRSSSRLSERLRSRPARAPAHGGASRSQAVEHSRHRRRAREAAGLRHLASARCHGSRRRPDDDPGAALDAHLRRARTDSRRSDNGPNRRLRAWRDSVRAAHRPNAVRPHGSLAGKSRADVAGRRAAATFARRSPNRERR